MKKDIDIPKVENIGVGIVREEEEGEMTWNVYLINYKSSNIDNVLISSKGYGTLNDQKVKTSTFSHYFEEIKSSDFQKIEPISEEVFGLTNEYFVTFYIDKVIHDKKFIFVPEAIKPENFTTIKVLGKKGVLIK